MLWIYGFTLEILERGDLLPITKTHNSNIFLPTLVNNAQDLMCSKNKPNFRYKLHPIDYLIDSMYSIPNFESKIKIVAFNEYFPGKIFQCLMLEK